MSNKLRILPDQCVFKQGDDGDAAFLILAISIGFPGLWSSLSPLAIPLLDMHDLLSPAFAQ